MKGRDLDAQLAVTVSFTTLDKLRELRNKNRRKEKKIRNGSNGVKKKTKQGQKGKENERSLGET